MDLNQRFYRFADGRLRPLSHTHNLVLGKGFEPLLTAHLANRGYKSRRATITLPKQNLAVSVGFEPTHRF